MAQITLKSLLAAGLILPLGLTAQNSGKDVIKSPEKPVPPATAAVSSPEPVPPVPKAAVQKKQEPEIKSIEYAVPCLTVRGDGGNGKISYLPLKFTRTKDNKPLRIMIADDTPNGSGKQIHSSMWLAAVTAAMLRNDTMHGTTISVEFSGNLDGPSAGSVTCLAILSAMDGLPLPNDFAMTGTILPDGTIGVVGGVPEKMRAAAKAGKKRMFIPAFLRFEKDAKGKNVDLQRLADELKIKLHRVENISEAYAALHEKPYSGDVYVNVREMTRLPKAVEDVLTATYKKYLDKVNAELKAQPDWEELVILSDYVLSPRKARQFYQEGKLLPATLQIFRSWQTWQAWKITDKFIRDFNKKNSPDFSKIEYLREYHFRKMLLDLREALKNHWDSCYEKRNKTMEAYVKKYNNGKTGEGYLPFRFGQGVFTAQLEPVEKNAVFSGIMQLYLARRVDTKTINSADMEALEKYWEQEFDILQILQLSLLPDDEYNDFMAELAAALPDKKANKRAAEVERLFYSASYAADSVAGDNFDLAMSSEAEKKEVVAELKNNPYFLPFLEMQRSARRIHYQLSPEAEKKVSYPEYHLQASLKAQVTTFTMASAILVMYGPDTTNDFVPHMLRNARNAAIRNINECVKAGIPCIAAIHDFEIAESRNGRGSIAVLMAYWRASLYAKALLMSFR